MSGDPNIPIPVEPQPPTPIKPPWYSWIINLNWPIVLAAVIMILMSMSSDPAIHDLVPDYIWKYVAAIVSTATIILRVTSSGGKIELPKSK